MKPEIGCSSLLLRSKMGVVEEGKLIQISNLFGVSMDYLLKEDCEEISVSKSASDSGYYVSQEMLDG